MGIHEFESVKMAAQKGGEWAWTRLYKELQPQLLGYLRVRGARDPEGLVGDVFLQLARNLGTFKGDETAFRSWVFMIAHNRLSNERRSRARKPDALPIADVAELNQPATESAENAAFETIDSDNAMLILRTLTPDQREVIALRVIADLSLDATAAIMGKRVGAVKQLQRRALIALRQDLEQRAVTL